MAALIFSSDAAPSMNISALLAKVNGDDALLVKRLALHPMRRRSGI